MKLKTLTAYGIHGHLDLKLSFNDDITFLIGVNGSGKTSALRLLMGLLTPSIAALHQIEFKAAVVEIESNLRTVTVSARRSNSGISLTCSDVDGPLEVSVPELHALRRGKSDELVENRIAASEVVRAIDALSTPMFLGLNRRTFDQHILSNVGEGAARRRFMVWRRRSRNDGDSMSDLDDVLFLVDEAVREQAEKQAQLDEKLRADLVVSAFTYTPVDMVRFRSAGMDSLRTLSEKRDSVRAVAESLSFPEINKLVDDFYQRMTSLHHAVDIATRRDAQSDSQRSKEYENAVMEWFIGQQQIERISGLIRKLADHADKRLLLSQPTDRFVEQVNVFLSQTGKRLTLDSRGRPRVEIHGTDRDLSTLSSGEKQIVVMLAHLALHKGIADSGIFIVDEPELSLHIHWQEMFVDSVREANPAIQVILATHSPAIVLDRVDCCVTMKVTERFERSQ